FPQRNRLISAFSDAVFVVQAAEASGSLVTAKIAAEFHGKTVMALPGSACSPEWAGSNRLLRDGALLVNNQDDLLAVLALLQKSAEANAKQNEDDAGSVGKNV
ncbi:MAG: DNA-processing protein DprA, partial [Planctomycetota bacterium]